MNVETALMDALNKPGYEALARTSEIHADIPRFLLAVQGASMNQELADWLGEQVRLEGQARGRSNQQPVVEEAEEPEDTDVEFPRPNGEIYYSRKWSGKKDVEVLKKARDNDKAPLLYGPPGTGKTALVDATFADLITVVMTGDTEVTDLVGGFVPNPNFGTEGEKEYMWVDGPLVVAAQQGRPILLDEVGLGDPKVLSIVYGLMDGRRELVVTANPDRGIVKAEPGFFVIGATNPKAPGVRLSEALLSRFALHVEVRTDYKLAAKLGVSSKIIAVSQNLAKKVDEGLLDWAPQMRELLAHRDISKVFDIDFANSNLIAACPEHERDIVIEVFRNVFGKTTDAAAMD